MQPKEIQQPTLLKEERPCIECDANIQVDEIQYGTPDEPLCSNCITHVDGLKTISAGIDAPVEDVDEDSIH